MNKISVFTLFLLVTTLFSCTKNNEIQKEALTHDELLNQFKKVSLEIKNHVITKNENTLNLDGPYTTFGDEFTEEQANALVIPLVQNTNIYLLQNYNIDLSETFSSLNDPRIALIGQAALRLEQLELEGKTIDTTWFNLQSFSKNTIVLNNNNDDDPDTFDCAMRAIGIEAAVKLLENGATAAANAAVRKAALRKAITKIASRFLGVFGAAIAIYEFGDCMEWW